MKLVNVESINISNNLPFVLIAGPCVIESEQHAIDISGKIKEICEALSIPFIYKSSFDKANRTSSSSFRGTGLDFGLDVLYKVKSTHNIPTLTDVHDATQPKYVALIVDILQIPAFLCRQTDLLIACGKAAKVYNKSVNIKKGQFLAPWDMKFVLEKVSKYTDKVMLCERGTSFGYNNLVTDFKSLIIMAETKYPVIFDATHSVQQPGGLGNKSGGNREFVKYLARAAASVGMAGLFMEVHEDPDNAPSDGPNMVRLDNLKEILEEIKYIDQFIKERNNNGK